MALESRAVVLAALVVLSCSTGEGPSEEQPLFPTDLAQGGYALVRDCRAPGEHSALAGFTVWVSPEAEGDFSDLFATPPGVARMPAESVVVKEVYSTPECAPGSVDHWVAMMKVPGFDPEHGDWRYQEVDADGGVVVDGAIGACIDCHRGGDDTSCVGFGEQNGKDYLCTAP